MIPEGKSPLWGVTSLGEATKKAGHYNLPFFMSF
jgi:hypothetical protein